jgi:hypothetical protein
MAEPILTGLKAIKSELKGIQDQLAMLDTGSEEFIKLAARAGELRDKMKDVKEAVSANAGPAIETFGNNLVIAQGQLSSLDLTGFGESLKRMGTNVKSISFKEMGNGIKSVTSGLGSLGKALLTNPIFLLATAIIAIVMNFEALTKAGGLVGKVFSFIGDTLDAVKKGMIAFSDAIGLTDSQAEARAEAAKKRMEDVKKFREDMDKFLDEASERNRTKNLSAQEKEIYDLKKKYGEMLDKATEFGQDGSQIQKLYREELQSINDRYAKADQEKANEEAKKRREQIQSDQKQVTDFLKEENEKRFQASLTEMDRELRQVQVNYDAKMKLAHGNAAQEKALTDSLTAEQNAIRQKYADAEIKRQQDVAKANADLLNQMRMEAITEEEELSQEIENIRMGARAAELQAVQDEFNVKIETANKYGLDASVLEEEMRKKKEEINKTYDDAEAAAAKEQAEKLKQIQADKWNSGLKLAQQAMAVLTSLNEATAKGDEASQRRAFERNKKLQKAMAVINMASGIVGAFSAPDNVTMVQKIASAAVVAAAGVANLVKINQTQFGGGTPPSTNVGGSNRGGASSGPSPASPNALNLSFLNNQATKPQPLQTYVVSGAVSSAQQADFKIKNQANIYNNG